MSKEDFLKQLREALQGEIPDYEVEKHIAYYRGYLSDISDGKSEKEKLDELGDPRLIARTLIDTESENFKDRAYDRTVDINTDGYSQYEESQRTKRDFFSHSFSDNTYTFKWYQKLLLAVIGILAVIVIIGLIIVGVNIFISIIVPVLIVVFIVRLIINAIYRR